MADHSSLHSHFVRDHFSLCEASGDVSSSIESSHLNIKSDHILNFPPHHHSAGVLIMISNYFIPSTDQYIHTYIIMIATLVEFFG
jgi:hypothetical protein